MQSLSGLSRSTCRGKACRKRCSATCSTRWKNKSTSSSKLKDCLRTSCRSWTGCSTTSFRRKLSVISETASSAARARANTPPPAPRCPPSAATPRSASPGSPLWSASAPAPSAPHKATLFFPIEAADRKWHRRLPQRWRVLSILTRICGRRRRV